MVIIFLSEPNFCQKGWGVHCKKGINVRHRSLFSVPILTIIFWHYLLPEIREKILAELANAIRLHGPVPDRCRIFGLLWHPTNFFGNFLLASTWETRIAFTNVRLSMWETRSEAALGMWRGTAARHAAHIDPFQIPS
jgi:hypothetical protein